MVTAAERLKVRGIESSAAILQLVDVINVRGGSSAAGDLTHRMRGEVLIPHPAPR